MQYVGSQMLKVMRYECASALTHSRVCACSQKDTCAEVFGVSFHDDFTLDAEFWLLVLFTTIIGFKLTFLVIKLLYNLYMSSYLRGQEKTQPSHSPYVSYNRTEIL